LVAVPTIKMLLQTKSVFYICVLALLSATLAAGEGVRSEDEVRSLPGWESKLPSRMFSGFFDATPKEVTPVQHMHYIFVESENDPKNDPVLVWSNGGPGAGSEFGLFTELGPLALSDASLQTEAYNKSGIPTLWRNEFAWTKFANVLIYDAPPPVGFSYCGDDVAGDGYSCGSWNDSRTSQSVYTFLSNWYDGFSDFKANDLYLSGESYAGVYIPTLARRILQGDDQELKNRLKGFAVGDACAGTEVDHRGPWFDIQFLFGHGQFSTMLYNRLLATCGVKQLQRGVTDQACENLLDAMDDQIGGYYSYDLYDDCGSENVLLRKSDWRRRRDTRQNNFNMIPSSHTSGGHPCGGVGAMLTWLNTSAVKDALHIPEGALFFLTDNGVGFNYSTTEKNLIPFYESVQRNTSLRVLVYNGDTDPAINSFFSQNWTSVVGLSGGPPVEDWRPWTLDGMSRMGGYVTRYTGDFDFLTIRGSGHMVPEYRPEAAYAFMRHWIRNEGFPKYSPGEL